MLIACPVNQPAMHDELTEHVDSFILHATCHDARLDVREACWLDMQACCGDDFQCAWFLHRVHVRSGRSHRLETELAERTSKVVDQ